MTRPGDALLVFLLIASLLLGTAHLLRGLRDFPVTLERSLSRRHHHIWLGGLREETWFIERVTPPSARLDIVLPEPQLRQVLGMPYSLFPRDVRVLSAGQPGTAPWVAEVRPAGTRRPSSSPREALFRGGRVVVAGPSASPAEGGPSHDLPASGSLLRGSLAIPLLAAFGWCLLRLVPLTTSLALRLGLSWFVGAGAYGLCDFVLSVAGLSVVSRLLLLAGIVALALCSGRRALPPRAMASPTSLPFQMGRAILVVLAILSVGRTGAMAALYPRAAMDSFAFWGIKAKALYAEGRLSSGFLARPYPHQDYPILGPTLEALGYRLAGGVRDDAVALFGAATLAAIGLVVAGGLSGRLAGPWPLLCAAAVVLNARLATEAGRTLMDVHVAGFALAGIVVLDLAAGRAISLLLSGGLFGLAGFTKNDGIPFAVAAVIYALLALGRRRRVAMIAGVAVALGPWLLFRAFHGLRTDIVNAEVYEALTLTRIAGQVAPVVRGLVPYVGSVTRGGNSGLDGGLLLAGCGIVLLLLRREADAPMVVLVLAALMVLGVYLALPPGRLQAYLLSTGHRVPLQLFPAGLYVAARALGVRSPEAP